MIKPPAASPLAAFPWPMNIAAAAGMSVRIRIHHLRRLILAASFGRGIVFVLEDALPEGSHDRFYGSGKTETQKKQC